MSESTQELPLEISVEQTRAALGNEPCPVLLDCRTLAEWEIARLEQAKLLPMQELIERLEELEPHREEALIVHCHHGGRSLQVVAWLRQQGFSQAQSMEGGIDAWSVSIDSAVPRY